VEEAVVELKKSSGQQFNPVYVSKFIELLEQKKIHTLSSAPAQVNK
jgi:HD-GYP domain-containing protein (c-di-GMP phosphodiesterase class II)